MKSPRTRLLLGVAALAVTGSALTGCGSSHDSTAPTTAPATTTPATTTPTTAPSATTAPSTQTSTAPPVTLITGPNNDKDRKNVALTSCESAPSGWQATGTATNPGAHAVAYTLTVYFTNAHATTLSSGQTKVRIAARGHASWKVRSAFAAPKKVLCVLVGVG
jgi:hypothetical protein